MERKRESLFESVLRRKAVRTREYNELQRRRLKKTLDELDLSWRKREQLINAEILALNRINKTSSAEPLLNVNVKDDQPGDIYFSELPNSIRFGASSLDSSGHQLRLGTDTAHNLVYPTDRDIYADLKYLNGLNNAKDPFGLRVHAGSAEPRGVQQKGTECGFKDARSLQDKGLNLSYSMSDSLQMPLPEDSRSSSRFPYITRPLYEPIDAVKFSTPTPVRTCKKAGGERGDDSPLILPSLCDSSDCHLLDDVEATSVRRPKRSGMESILARERSLRQASQRRRERREVEKPTEWNVNYGRTFSLRKHLKAARSANFE